MSVAGGEVGGSQVRRLLIGHPFIPNQSHEQNVDDILASPLRENRFRSKGRMESLDKRGLHDLLSSDFNLARQKG